MKTGSPLVEWKILDSQTFDEMLKQRTGPARVNGARAVLAGTVLWVFCLSAFGQSGGRESSFEPNKDVKTGIEVGQPVPSFQLLDQFGKQQDFSTIKGPRGAVLIFFRSADW
ncbi:MAG: hypothetical protein HY315_01965 [Acidobacteria bacterium]|nr:hypothetical protein [Acidobacteriota bacterium]